MSEPADLPSGFTLDEEENIPPPPPGFKLDGQEPTGPESTLAGTVRREVGAQLVPVISGTAGAALGAEIGALGGPVLAVLGGLAGGIGAGLLTAEAQAKLFAALPESLQKMLGQDEAQQSADVVAHPDAKKIAGFMSQLAVARPGAVQAALKDAPAIIKMISGPVSSRVAGATFGGGLEAINETVGDQPYDPASIAMGAATGAVLNKPNTFGKYIDRKAASLVSPNLRNKPATPDVPGEETPPHPINTMEAAVDILKANGVRPETVKDPIAAAQKIYDRIGEDVNDNVRHAEDLKNVDETVNSRGPPGQDFLDTLKTHRPATAAEENLDLLKAAKETGLVHKEEGTPTQELLKAARDSTLPADDSEAKAFNPAMNRYIESLKPGDRPLLSAIQEASGAKTRREALDILDRYTKIGQLIPTEDGYFQRSSWAPESGLGNEIPGRNMTPPARPGEYSSDEVNARLGRTPEPKEKFSPTEEMPPPSAKPRLSSRAKDLLNKIDEGNATPGFMSRGLRDIAAENDIHVTDEHRPQDIIDALRAKADERIGTPAHPEQTLGEGETLFTSNQPDSSLKVPGRKVETDADFPRHETRNAVDPNVAKSEWSDRENGKSSKLIPEQETNIRALVKHLAGDSVMATHFKTTEEIGRMFEKGLVDEAHPAYGIYYDMNKPRTGIIAVATEGGYADTANLAAHEAFHAADKWLSKKRERQAIVNDFARIEKGLRELLGNKTFDRMTQTQLRQEIPAYAFQVYSKSRMSDGRYPMPNWIRPPVRRFLEPVYQFFDKIRHALTGKTSMTAEHFFNKMLSGEVGRRKSNKVPRDYSKPLAAQASLKGKEEFDRPQTGEQIMKDSKESMKDNVGFKKVSDLLNLDGLFKHGSALASKYPKTYGEAHKIFGQIRDWSNNFRTEHLHNLTEAYKKLTPEEQGKVSIAAEAAQATRAPFKKDPDGKIRIPVREIDDWGMKTHVENSLPGQVLVLEGDVADAFLAGQRATIAAREAIIQKTLLKQNGFDENSTVAQLRASDKPLAHKFADIIEAWRDRPNYFPQIRFGNQAVTVHEKLDAAGKPYAREDRPLRWLQSEEILGKDGTLLKKASKAWANRDGGKMQQIKKRLEERFHDKNRYEVSDPYEMTYDTLKKHLDVGSLEMASSVFGSHNPEMAKRWLEDIQGELSARGAKKHFQHKDNIPGWLHKDNVEGYSSRAISNYLFKVSTQAANAEYANKLNAEINSPKMADYPQMKAYIERRREYINNGSEEAQAIRNLSYLWFLGLNPASAIVNLTQTLHTTFPVLSSAAGPKAIPEIARGLKYSMSMFKDPAVLKAMFSGDPLAILKAKKPSGMSDDMWKAVQQTIRDGELLPSQSLEQAALMVGQHDTLSGARKKLNAVSQIMSGAFSMAEGINRVTAFTAAYTLAKNNPELIKKSFNTLRIQVDTPLDYAKAAVKRTQFTMDRVNRAEFMQGKGAIPTQFMSFPVQMLELSADMLIRQGAEGKIALGLMGMAMIATSGVWSTPGMDNVKDIIEGTYKLFSDRDLDLDSMMREAMAEVGASPNIIQGMSRGFVPLATKGALAGRAGAGQIVNPGMLSGDLSQMTGPAGGMIAGSALNFWEHYKKGENYLAISALFPAFAKNISKAAAANPEMLGLDGIVPTKGFRSQTGREQYITPDKVTPGMIANQLLGFTPEQVGERAAQSNALRRLDSAGSKLQQRYNYEAGEARLEQIRANQRGDNAGAMRAGKMLQEIYEEVKQKNTGAKPEDRIKLSPASIAQHVRQGLKPEAGDLKKVNKRSRSRAAELQSLFNT